MKYPIHTLSEPYGPGICPVCKVCWIADPRLECACTRAQPDDEEQMQKAYLNSALSRAAKIRSDQTKAERSSQTVRQSFTGPDRQPGNVIPLIRRWPPGRAGA